MTREEAIGCLRNKHTCYECKCYTGCYFDELSRSCWDDNIEMAICSLEKWDEVIGHLETTASELIEREDEKNSHAFAKGITFAVAMMKNHLKEVESGTNCIKR